MLEGIRSNVIIAGAYAEGICPMLAAHRANGRTNCISFARAWDRFAFRDGRDRRARRATERELLVLATHLQASLLDDEEPALALSAALTEHRELVDRRRAEGERPREADGERPRACGHRARRHPQRVEPELVAS